MVVTVAATVITQSRDQRGVVLGVLTAMVLFVRRVAPHRGDRGALR